VSSGNGSASGSDEIVDVKDLGVQPKKPLGSRDSNVGLAEGARESKLRAWLVGKWKLLTSPYGLAFIIICAVAVAIRSIPAWIYAGWGDDLGIYYGLTTEIIRQGVIFPEYTGWGGSYEHFPVLYLVTAIPHLITGVDPYWLMVRIAPIFGGLSVAFAYSIARNIGFDRRTAILAMALLAVNSIHVYQTSHAAPLTMGHFFMLASISLLVRSDKKNVHWALLVASTVLLVASHHLTTYIFLISIPAMLALQRKEPTKEQLAYLAFSAGFTFIYWGTAATELLDFAVTGSGLPLVALAVLYIVFVAVLLMLRGPFKSVVAMISKPVTRRTEKLKFWFAFFAFLCVISIPAILGKPSIPLMTRGLAIWSIPIFAILAFGSAGISRTTEKSGGPEVAGWFIAISISLMLAVSTGSTILLPERHIEYLMEPLSIFAAMGMACLMGPSFDRALSKETRRSFVRFGGSHHEAVDIQTTGGYMEGRGVSQPSFGSCDGERGIWVEETSWTIRARAVVPVLAVILLVGSAFASYRILPEIGFVEEISEEDYKAIDWLVSVAENSTTNISVVTDHRLGTNLQMNGVNAIFEKGTGLWNSTTWQGYVSVLSNLSATFNCTRIEYILVDDVMLSSGSLPVSISEHKLSNFTYQLFKQQPFELAVDPFASDDGETWAEVYWVNWSFVENRTASAARSVEGKVNVEGVQSTSHAPPCSHAGRVPRKRCVPQ
jgi:hypothetical protein